MAPIIQQQEDGIAVDEESMDMIEADQQVQKQQQRQSLLLSGVISFMTLVFFCFLFGADHRDIKVLQLPLTASIQAASTGKSQRELELSQLALSSNFSVEELRTLDRVLEKVEFRNKTVILTTLNQAWSANNSMIDLFLEGFHTGIGTEEFLPHLVIIALDQPSYERCLELHPHCFKLMTEGVDFSGEQKYFMTDDYLEMMWRRIYFLRVVLQLGYSFVFSDSDILWFREPFSQFDPASDFEIACDHFVGIENDLSNGPNGGYVHAVSSNKTIALYKLWHDSRLKFPGRHDQDVLNDIKMSPEFAELQLRVRFLSTQLFSGFCEKSSDFEQIRTMHANCCGSGLENKLQDLRLALEDWKLFKCMTSDQKSKYKLEWRSPRYC